MKLSLGLVDDSKLVCPYHGWSFGCDGNGQSPSAPHLQASVTSYECKETAGAIWIKARGSRDPLPRLKLDEWSFAGVVFNKVGAPLELVIDNFSEVEHTLTTHPDFGFDRARAAEAVVELSATADAISLANRGPAKMPPLDMRLAVALRRGDLFHSNYTLQFDPPRSAVTHLWTDPHTGRERMLKYRVLHYFVPEDPATTNIVTFGFLKIGWPVLRHFGRPSGWLFRRKLRRAVDEDAFLLENLADKSPDLAGMKLGRFDPVLGLTRERLQRIYYGNSADRASNGGPMQPQIDLPGAACVRGG